MTATLTDTYAAAIQHGTVDLPATARRIGVVRRPPPWFYAAIDENRRELGPPEELLDAVKRRHEELIEAGVEDAVAHNRAMDELDYEARYRTYVSDSTAARAEIDDLRSLIEAGEDVVLVCFENTENKRCHRTILRDVIRSGPD